MAIKRLGPVNKEKGGMEEKITIDYKKFKQRRAPGGGGDTIIITVVRQEAPSTSVFYRLGNGV